MREFVGGAIIVNVVIAMIYLLHAKSVDWKGAIAIGIVGIIAGIVTPNLSFVSNVVLAAGEGRSLSVKIDRQVQTVIDKTEEVKEIRDNVGKLAEQIDTAKSEINKSKEEIAMLSQSATKAEKEISASKQEISASKTEVAATAGKVSTLMQAYTEVSYLDFSTRNIIPPPAHVQNRVLAHLNEMAAILYPNESDRAKFVARMQGELLNAVNPPQPAKH